MATEKETKKDTTVVFEHRDNKYFLFTMGRLSCQFINSKYSTSNQMEIKALRAYAYNQPGILREVRK